MFGGEGAYVPHPSSAVDMKLRLHEIVNVFDVGLVAHPARALLDTGALQELQLHLCLCNSHTLCGPMRQYIVRGMLSCDFLPLQVTPGQLRVAEVVLVLEGSAFPMAVIHCRIEIGKGTHAHLCYGCVWQGMGATL